MHHVSPDSLFMHVELPLKLTSEASRQLLDKIMSFWFHASPFRYAGLKRQMNIKAQTHFRITEINYNCS